MQATDLLLRKTVITDLEIFYLFQCDEKAIQLAAFTPKDPHNKEAYLDKYSKLLIDPTINMQTILWQQSIAGSVSKYEMEGDAEITYWIDRRWWGKGIASAALKKFLTMESARPIFGKTAWDNIGSQKVLEHNGFKLIGKDRGFANARKMEIEEFIFKLEK